MKLSTLFHFENENLSLIEVRRDDLPEDASKENQYFWLKLDKDGQVISRLNFVSMSSEEVNGNQISVREFEDAELRFDSDIAKFATMNESHLLLNKSKEMVSPEMSKHLQNYLQSL